MSDGQSVHLSVLVDKIVHWLDPRPGQTLVDGTLGGGGYTRRLAERVGEQGQIVAIDRDGEAIERCRESLAGLPIQFVQGNFCDLPEALDELGIDQVDGVALDLGLSSDQLADADRGFSFQSEGPLDLRFDPTRGEPAWRLLEVLREKTLADLIYEFGEERFSRRIARKIVERRQGRPVRTASDLADLVRSCYRGPRREKIDPATRTFQALRIAVNDELKSLDVALRRLPERIRPGGKLAIVSFHSLEDRRVKTAFRDDDRYEPLMRKPITADENELTKNPRSRSAKLRVAAIKK